MQSMYIYLYTFEDQQHEPLRSNVTEHSFGCPVGGMRDYRKN
jgi:hypothetical protein